MTNPTLEAIELRKVYQTLTEEIVVLESVSFSMNAGGNLAIVGPSGSGKSTLLQILGTLDAPTSGTVRIGGQDPYQLNENQQARFRNERIGFIFQDHHLLPQLSALENVLLPTLALAKKPDEAQVRAAGRELLAKVGLTGKEDRRPAQLSGGERQRVALARALINKPKLILADEPTGALDVANAGAVADVLLALNRDLGTALVVVTHSPALAARMSRQIDFARGTPA